MRAHSEAEVFRSLGLVSLYLDLYIDKTVFKFYKEPLWAGCGHTHLKSQYTGISSYRPTWGV